jgi:hypothetical protein
LGLFSSLGGASDDLVFPLERSVRLGVNFCLPLDFVFEGVGCGLAAG